MNLKCFFATSFMTLCLASCGSFGEAFLTTLSSGAMGMNYGGSGGGYVNTTPANFNTPAVFNQPMTFTYDPGAATVPVTVPGGTTTTNGSSSSSPRPSSGSSSEKSCKLCHGLGKCWTCNGKRYYLNPLTGKNIACPNCTDGNCSSCGGTGKK